MAAVKGKSGIYKPTHTVLNPRHLPYPDNLLHADFTEFYTSEKYRTNAQKASAMKQKQKELQRTRMK